MKDIGLEQPFKILVSDFNIDIEKGGSKNAPKRLIVSGIASTMDEDVDGDILDPDGFDCTYLMHSGFINWHHSFGKNPGAIIGEPLEVTIKDKKMHVRAELYDWNPLAVEVYNLADQLKKSKSGRKLGWSIEGKSVSVSEMGGKRYITKTIITGIAITPMPRNNGTSLDIVKGDVSDLAYFGQIENWTDEEMNSETYLIDIVKANGDRICIDRQFNIKIIQKDKELNAVSVGPVADFVEKSFNTETAGMLIPESLEGKQKDLITIHKAFEAGQLSPKTFDRVKKKINSLIRK